jgi:upstream activation factor subunit UAF30
MVRQTKTPVTTTKRKAVASKKTSPVKDTAPTPAPSPAPAAAPTLTPETVSTLNEVTTPDTINDEFSSVITELMTLRSSLTALTARVRLLKTRSEREVKQAVKDVRKRRSANRSPSGFVKPTKISNELADFVGRPRGSEMARTEVTRVLTAYIREHKLQDPLNGRRILADSKLGKLLKLQKTDDLTYFNLQKHMSPHFAKKGDTQFDLGA